MSAFGGKADMRWVVHAATEERNTCAIHKPAGPAEPRGNSFLGAGPWIFLKDGSVFLVVVAMAHWKFCHLWC